MLRRLRFHVLPQCLDRNCSRHFRQSRPAARNTPCLRPRAGTLDLPGGFVDPGESVEESLRREVREETGGEVAEAAYLFSLPNIYLFSGMEVHTADMFFRCRLTDENAVKAADDAAELLWLPREEVCPTLFGLDSIRRGVERLTNVEE